VLATTGLSVDFGGVHALSNVSFEVGEGELVGLIGPNGAGKTTFVDAVTGFVRCSGGIRLDGREIGSLPAHRRARLGLARTWQSIELFDDLTVRENLHVAAHRPSVWGIFKETVWAPGDGGDAYQPVLELLGLTGFLDAMPDELAQGQRKLVGIARALVAGPRLICLDEPAAGLDTTESVELGRRLRGLVDAGQAMVLVDHDMGLVLGICDVVVVLEFGKVIAAGPPGEVRRNPQVIEAYLGSAASAVTGG
jgi:branched-chain amino acid transport system ATP-binding protein